MAELDLSPSYVDDASSPLRRYIKLSVGCVSTDAVYSTEGSRTASKSLSCFLTHSVRRG
jgi:hypothetical protein